jgi:4-hydroxybenzoate polyprenyltransferase
MNSYTDIAADGWVASLPPAMRPYALLARLDRPIGAWLLFLPGLWSILLAQAPWRETGWLIALFFIGAFLMRGAGCVVNDMWDRDLDRQVTRTAGRPLASGALRMRHAAIFLALLLSISLVILLQLTPLAQALGVGSLVLVALYPLAKRVTWWPQLMLGFTFGWGAPMGFAAGAGRIDAAALVLYAGAIFWILGYDTIYAHQDREDDALVGIKSTARLFAGNSRPFLLACYGATTILLAAAAYLVDLNLAVPGIVLGAVVFLGRQIKALDIDDPALCLKLFKSNREFGLFIAAMLVIARL